jgi:hypothetical protein
MNKHLLVFTALITFGFTKAQIKEKGTIEITPKIGTSNFYENNEDDATKYNSGVEFGATVDYYFNNRWSLRSGLIADKMGGKYKISFADYDPIVNGDTTIYFEDKLNYLSIPINANWHFGSTRKWNLNFGLSPSFLTSANIVINGKESKIPSSDIESFQLGLTYGIGYKIEINKKFGILIDTQFFNGLTNINKSSEARIVNAGYSLNVGGVIQL